MLALGELAERQSRGAFRARRAGPAGEAVLDPTGVVKGWAVERAADHLRALEATDFCLSAGGDMVCRTLDRDAPPWRIGIEDPHHTDRLVAVAPVHTGAVATSGTAHRGDHLVDARTGRPPAGVASVTVVAASLTWADIDATAAYAHGRDAARCADPARPQRPGGVVGRVHHPGRRPSAHHSRARQSSWGLQVPEVNASPSAGAESCHYADIPVLGQLGIALTVIRLGGGHTALHPRNWPAPRAGPRPRFPRLPGGGGSTGVEEDAGAEVSVAA